MDINRKSCIAIVIGIFLMIATLISGDMLAGKLEMLNGGVGLDKIILSPLYDNRDQGEDKLKLETLEKLQEKMSGYLISYSTSQKTVAEFEGRKMSVSANAVDASYIKFKYLNFVKGGYWSANTDREQGMVAVIDSEAAARLFGSTDVLGMIFKLAGTEYRVIGVTQQETSLINKLFYDGSSHIYIPISSFINNNNEATIREIQIADYKEDSIDLNEIKAALSYIGESPEKYSIMDFRKNSQKIRQKSQLIMFFLGLLIEVILFKLGKRIVLKIIFLIKNDCKADYLMNVVKIRYREVLTSLTAIFVILCASVLILDTIRFDLYIPTDLIPDELIDLSFWGRLIENKLQGGMNNLEQYRNLTEIQFLRVNKLQNFAITMMVPSGFLLIYYGYLNIKLNQENIIKTIFMWAAVLISEVCIWVLLSGLVGLPMLLSSRNLLILWGFIFLKTIMVYLKEENLKC